MESTPIISRISSIECCAAMRLSRESISVPKYMDRGTAVQRGRTCTSVAPGLAQELDYVRDRRAAHDAVVHEYDALAAHRGGYGVELYPHGVLPAGLPRLDEGAADILVLHKAHAVGYAALPRVAERGVEAGIRHAYHHVRLPGVLQREERARALPRGVHAASVDNGVRPGEVDELKHALRARPAAVAAVALHASRVIVTISPGSTSRRELCAYRVERAALAGYAQRRAARLCTAGGSRTGRRARLSACAGTLSQGSTRPSGSPSRRSRRPVSSRCAASRGL